MNIYKMEEIIYKLHRVERMRDMVDKQLPEVILDYESKMYEEAKSKYPGLEEVYEEFLALKESSNLYVKAHKLEEGIEMTDSEGNEVGVLDMCVYEVRCKDKDTNVFNGILFDSEDLAYAHLYRVEKDKHPKFDELYDFLEAKRKEESAKERLLKAIFGEE